MLYSHCRLEWSVHCACMYHRCGCLMLPCTACTTMYYYTGILLCTAMYRDVRTYHVPCTTMYYHVHRYYVCTYVLSCTTTYVCTYVCTAMCYHVLPCTTMYYVPYTYYYKFNIILPYTYVGVNLPCPHVGTIL